MNWKNVSLILRREIRDQLRDRRMMFMFLVLPIVLYPLLGMVIFQMGQFLREHPTQIQIAGLEHLPESPKLVVAGKFNPDLFRYPEGWDPSRDPKELKDPALAVKRRADRLVIKIVPAPPADTNPGASSGDPKTGPKDLTAPQNPSTPQQMAAWRELLQDFDVMVVFPPDFSKRITEYRQHLAARRPGSPNSAKDLPKLPAPKLYYDSAKEKSQTAFYRVREVLEAWGEAIVREGLAASDVPSIPFRLEEKDIADSGHRNVAVWAKIFPFLLIIWALTGAFQPAVDLCAGEKERGTLETLLCSPTPRIDIVCGKLLAIMVFSIGTVVLNLLSMGLTGLLLLSKVPNFGPPPLISGLWLALALVPISAFFSALCLALSTFARSVKEGHYYMIPLFVIVMPLVMVAMAPGAELTLGTSIVPISGVVLLLRVVIEGDYQGALPYVLPVLAVTVLCAVASIRWAVDLFNRETVLFREAEQFDLRLWLKSLYQKRGPTPSVLQAMGLGLVLVMAQFLVGFFVRDGEKSFREFVVLVIALQLAVFAAPPLLLTFLLTRDWRSTLLLRLPAWQTVPAAVLLAVTLHPLAHELQRLIQWMYPIPEQMKQALKVLEKMMEGGNSAANLGLILLMVAVLPAICEELAFRGFILSGLRQRGHRWRPIVVSSLLFGFAHGLLQQSLSAAVIGIVLGYLAVQSNSLLPGMVYHFCHNALVVLSVAVVPWLDKHQPTLAQGLFRFNEAHDDYSFRLPLLIVSGMISLAILWWWSSLPNRVRQK